MKKAIKIVLIATISFATVILAIKAYSVNPQAWNPPTPERLSPKNNQLASAQPISLHGWFGPEDIEFDSAGYIYTGVHSAETDFSNGVILKTDSTGKEEVFLNTRSWVAGLHFDANGNLIALSHKQGLISIDRNKNVSVLADKDEYGNPFLIPNGLDISADGKIYFSNTSEEAAYNIGYGKKIILEMKPLGGLYCYDPSTKKIKTLISGSYFGNGVVVSKDQTHVLMVETAKYRVLRYWIAGEKAGTTDTFIDNLPGFPNGISIRPDGSYWLGFSTIRSEELDNIHANPALKRLVYALPDFLQPKAKKFGLVMHISSEGRVLQSLMDTSGKVMPEAGAVKEFRGHLYLGGDIVPHIGKYKIDDPGNNEIIDASVPSRKLLKLSDSSFRALKHEFGVNKELPIEYEEQVLIALSHFPELKQIKIKWVIKDAYTPLSTRPAYGSVLQQKNNRAYVITISNKTIDTLKHLLFSNLSFDQQVGIMGHELSHVLDFKNKNLLQSFKNLVGHFSPKYLDRMEYLTDMICIEHGLGEQLREYSNHVRKTMHVDNWRGVDYVYNDQNNPERYMNPSTIDAFVKLYANN